VDDHQFRLGIAAAIRAIRAERRWTQRELCRRTELSPAYLSELESGQKDASADVLQRLAAAFDYRMDEFLWVAVLGMIHGEVPNAERRTSALELTKQLLNSDPQSRAELDQFLEFQSWKQEQRRPGKRRPQRPATKPAIHPTDRTTPDFTEDL
jgi:transcriptional regulator with XRE-family HTH domain